MTYEDGEAVETPGVAPQRPGPERLGKGLLCGSPGTRPPALSSGNDGTVQPRHTDAQRRKCARATARKGHRKPRGKGAVQQCIGAERFSDTHPASIATVVMRKCRCERVPCCVAPSRLAVRKLCECFVHFMAGRLLAELRCIWSAGKRTWWHCNKSCANCTIIAGPAVSIMLSDSCGSVESNPTWHRKLLHCSRPLPRLHAWNSRSDRVRDGGTSLDRPLDVILLAKVTARE